MGVHSELLVSFTSCLIFMSCREPFDFESSIEYENGSGRDTRYACVAWDYSSIRVYLCAPLAMRQQTSMQRLRLSTTVTNHIIEQRIRHSIGE